MKSKINGESKNDHSIRVYIDEFIGLRNSFPTEGLSEKPVFVNETDAITKSEVYLKNIIKNKAEDSLYLDLTSRLERFITTAQLRYENTISKKEWLKTQTKVLKGIFDAWQEKKMEPTPDSYLTLKNNSWPIICLLAISFLTNLVLGILFFRNRNKIQKVGIQENSTLKAGPKLDSPIVMTPLEVDNHISRALVQLQTDLTGKYHPDCVKAQIEKLDSLISEISQKSKSRQFTSSLELENFVTPLIKRYQTSMVEKLAEVLDKQSAILFFERKIDDERFVLKYASSLVPEEEIRLKMRTLKKRAYNEMTKVITKSELETTIQSLGEVIAIALEKMIKENSKLYFPYADAQGTLHDDKKSKEKERDSAIILTLDPKDKTRATFQLLYEYFDMMQAGIESYDILLLPICNLKSEDFNRNGTKIYQNGKDGEMFLKNGRWKLTNKLTIKII